MRNFWIALDLAVIVISAVAALAGEPEIVARPGFPVDQSIGRDPLMSTVRA